MYKQAVESTDIFLGMSGKDESSTSCEDMVVRVELPEVSSLGGEWQALWMRHQPEWQVGLREQVEQISGW